MNIDNPPYPLHHCLRSTRRTSNGGPPASCAMAVRSVGCPWRMSRGHVSDKLSDNHHVRRRTHPDSRELVSRLTQQWYAGHRGAHIASGRRGRGFESRHPDSPNSQVIVRALLCWHVASVVPETSQPPSPASVHRTHSGAGPSSKHGSSAMNLKPCQHTGRGSRLTSSPRSMTGLTFGNVFDTLPTPHGDQS